mgnify:CR=1 FL=1
MRTVEIFERAQNHNESIHCQDRETRMSVKPEKLSREAQKFSLQDYVTHETIQEPAQVQSGFVFDLASNLEPKKVTRPDKDTSNITFRLPNMQHVNHVSHIPRRDEDRLVPAGLISGGGSNTESIRLKALLEEERLKHAKLSKKLAVAEQNVVKANSAFQSEQAAAKGKVNQLLAELKASRNSEACLKRELVNSSATAATQAEETRFRLVAEKTVAVEDIQRRLDAKDTELTSTKQLLDNLNLEYTRVCADIESLRAEHAKENTRDPVIEETVAEIAAAHDKEHEIMQAEIDKVTSEKVMLQQTVVDLTNANEDTNALLSSEKVSSKSMQSKLDEATSAKSVLEQRIVDLTKANDEARTLLSSEKVSSQSMQSKLDEATSTNSVLKQRVVDLAKAKEEVDVLLSSEKASFESVQSKLEDLEQNLEERVAKITEMAEEKVLASNQRFEALSATLPDKAQQALDKYSGLLSRAKMLNARVEDSPGNAVAAAATERQAREVFETLCFGVAPEQRYFTRERAEPRPVFKKPDITLPTTRMACSSATSTDMIRLEMVTCANTYQLDSTLDAFNTIAAMPKVNLDDRINRAVTSIKVDLAAALNSCKHSYSVANGEVKVGM